MIGKFLIEFADFFLGNLGKNWFYGMIFYKKKLVTWEKFYNLWRPHSSHAEKPPYEALRKKLKNAA
jgi:hypothetical protein